MILENEFTIDAPLEEVWKALNSPEFVAPCFPGANLTDYTGDTFTGVVKVKLGPISLTYKGEGTYLERNDDSHTVVISAKGRDSRGNGTAAATVTGEIAEDVPGRCRIRMRSDISITGRPAQFGRGVISDVADSIIGKFAGSLAAKLAADDEPADAMNRQARGEPTASAPAAASTVRPSGDNALRVTDLLKIAVPKPVGKAAAGFGALLLALIAIAALRSRK